MKWFKHDSCANRDEKLEKVLLRYGADGYALYWLCLELIADRIDSSNIEFELKHDAETLGARLKIDTLRVEEIMKFFIKLELFECENTRITCLKLAERIENAIVKSIEVKKIQEKIRENPGKSRKIRENSGQIRLEERRRDKKADTDLDVLSSPENSLRPQHAAREDAAAAAVDPQPAGIAPELWTWALKRARANPKARNPVALARKIVTDPIDLAEFERERAQAEAGKTKFLPEPPPCSCGAKLKADLRNGFARCPKCSSTLEWDRAFDFWHEEQSQSTA